MTGGRGFTDQEARAAWNQGADAWEEFVESGADYYRHEVHGPALLAACGPADGARALDLGCGQGYFRRRLARRGARVAGVDLAERSVDHARRHEAREPLGVEYHVLSAADVGGRWPEGSFDLVSACMSLHDMADPAAALRGAFAVLRPGGRMAFSITHPLTDLNDAEWERDAHGVKEALRIRRYFDKGAGVCHWSMKRLRYHWDTPYWRRTLEEWSAMVADAGFLVRRLHEPRPTEEQVRRLPRLRDSYRLPYFLIFDLVRP